MGYGGMISFGHAVYIGIGGYTVGILSFHGIDNGWIQWPVALALCGLFSLIFGAISLRTRGVYFIMITLAFAQMMYFLSLSIEKYGSDFQKEKYLKPLASGKKIGAYSLSEPQSGSDASNMRTIAKRDGDYYVVSGTKNWVTNGINSDIVMLFAMTEVGVGHKGISCFIVEKGWDGFEVGKPEDKLGIRGSDTSELYFDNVKIPADNLVGGEGIGFKIALTTLDGGRIGIASQALGIAQASLDASISYSKERVQFGKPISINQGIQFKLADMAMGIETARLLIHKAAWAKQNGLDYGHLASMAKVYASEVAMKASTECVQIHGGYGYIRESGVERLMRDAKITQIYEGTSEIQRLVIARALLK